MAGYGTDSGFTDWITENGYVLPADAPTPAVLRQRGSTYIDALYGRCFYGCKTGGYLQERSWPRKGVRICGESLPSDIIPLEVIQASYWAAWIEATNPGSLYNSVDQSREIKRQKVEDIEREFFQSKSGEEGAVGLSPLFSTVDGLLGPFVDQVCMGREDPDADGLLGIWAVGC